MNGKRYVGEFRKEISFPVGGIGTGCIGLDGYGRLLDWEIFNRPCKRSFNGYSHFAIKAERNGKVIDARVMNADAEPGFMGEGYEDINLVRKYPTGTWRGNYGFGPHRELMGGIPHFKDCTFVGRFPFAEVEYEDEAFPGCVSLNAFNPFIPIDDAASSIPVAFYTVKVQNTTADTMDYTVALSLNNPQPGIHRNDVIQDESICGICLTDTNEDANDPVYGQLAMAVNASENADYQQYWFHGSWFDDLSLFWQDFTAPGRIRRRTFDNAAMAEWKGRDTATLLVSATLKAGESRTFRFAVAWYYPTFVNYWSPKRENETCDLRWKNYYASLFDSAVDAAAYALKNWDSLEKRTQSFADTLYGSDLPAEALDAVTANISLLKSPTCLRLSNGEFYGFEGCMMNSGCCEGSCTHVWNYAFALPFLFPKLERSMRELDYTYNQRDDGGMVFRLKLPLGRERGTFRPCVDGLMGGIIKFYREWKICGDDAWLRKWWPKVQKSLEFAWVSTNADKWDPRKTGIITGRQHHTLDMELFGPNAWLNTFYLAALKAACEISDYLGNVRDTELYRAMYQNGKAFTEKELFNGEYFAQKVDLEDKSILEQFDVDATGNAVSSYWNPEAEQIKYQIDNGCGIDQVLAQWMSDLSGLGDILDPEMVKSALASIYRYNFCPEIRSHFNPCRLYSLNDEAGTAICAWPEGVTKPVVPIPYAEETMHGFEYQAASHMILRGFEEQGLRMVKSIRNRYDGRRRNPWNEMECGSNYARSMASYALLLVYSGFTYDMPRKSIGFRPLKGKGRFFWSIEGAWGSVLADDGRTAVTVQEGQLTLKEITVPFTASSVLVNGNKIRFSTAGSAAIFDNEVCLRAGDTITVA